MKKSNDLTGQRFGRLTVIERSNNSNDGHARWLCRCDCGNIKVVASNDLKKKERQHEKLWLLEISESKRDATDQY